jgi:peptidoglycan hydrolase-like protein with peptidoglycan-binding domain
MDSIPVLQLGDLRIAEVGTEREIEISEAIVDLKVSLSSRQPTSIMFKVYDHDFRMFNANYFQVRRELSYLGQTYEIAAVTLSRAPAQADTVDIRAGSRAIQRLARDKGAQTWNGITAAEFAKLKAEEFGLQMFIQQSTKVDSITRIQSEERDESTWDILQRLASELEYVCFESYNVLYFTSEDYLLERQPSITINIGSGVHGAAEDDPWYPYAFSVQSNDDDWAGSALSVKLPRKNAQGLRPGMGIRLSKGGSFSGTTPGVDPSTYENIGATRVHMVTDVKWTEGTSEPVQVSARTLKETDDTVADVSVGRGVVPFGSRTLQEGDVGNDVTRLQMAIGMSENQQDGIFGPITKNAVMVWQRQNKLGIATTTKVSDADPADRSFFGELSEITTYDVDGIIDKDDWDILLAAARTLRRHTDFNKVQMSMAAAYWAGLELKVGAVEPSDGSGTSQATDADRKFFF